MPRSKKTASKRQRQSVDVVYIEPPPEHQFARFFSRFDDPTIMSSIFMKGRKFLQ
ncbi:hypothetical protein PIB30_102986, partial [Stylosanthes scabra]|nr:hypothetical protein [Stylosanthes scabra]